ncbi:MAG: hypothetical protein H0W29_07020 [Gemmatimonadales bacterium]|nr:hypothetical protein [Gemmatimonadales bacterium]
MDGSDLEYVIHGLPKGGEWREIGRSVHRIEAYNDALRALCTGSWEATAIRKPGGPRVLFGEPRAWGVEGPA